MRNHAATLEDWKEKSAKLNQQRAYLKFNEKLITHKQRTSIYNEPWMQFKRSFLIIGYFNILFAPTLMNLIFHDQSKATMNAAKAALLIISPLLNVAIIPTLVAKLEEQMKNFYGITITPEPDVDDRIPWVVALPFIEKLSYYLIGNLLALKKSEAVTLLISGSILQLIQAILHVTRPGRAAFLDNLYSNPFFTSMGQLLLFGKLLPKLLSLLRYVIPKSIITWAQEESQRFDFWVMKLWRQTANHKNKVPLERQLPDDFLRIATMFVYVGYWLGMGAGVFMAALSGNPEDAITNKDILLRTEAIGALMGLGSSVLYLVLKSCFVYRRKKQLRRNRNNNIELRDPTLECQWQYNFWGNDKFASFDIRLFLATQAGAILGTVFTSNAGGLEQKLEGAIPGLGIGTLVAAVVAMRFLPMTLCAMGHCLNYLCKRFFKYEFATAATIRKIPAKKWYAESRHSLPFYVRLFFGAFTGYVAASVLSTAKNQFGGLDYLAINRNQLLASLTIGHAALFSPVFFAIFRYLTKNCFQKQQNDNKSFRPVRWYTGTRIDVAWYIRICTGVVAAATIAATLKECYAEHAVNKTLVYAVSAISWAWPLLSEMWDQLIQWCNPNFVKQKKPPPVKLSYDMPWYARAAFATMVGAMIGKAAFYANTDPSSYSNKTPSSHLPLNFMWLTLSLAMITPAVMAGLARCGFKHKIFNPTHETKDDLSWPWYARALAGLWFGALVGGSMGHLVSGHKEIISGNIGPAFLNISNQYGAPTTALTCCAIAILWPLLQFGWEQAKNKMFGGPMNCFKRIGRDALIDDDSHYSHDSDDDNVSFITIDNN